MSVAASTGDTAVPQAAGPGTGEKHLYQTAQEPDECCDVLMGFPGEQMRVEKYTVYFCILKPRK